MVNDQDYLQSGEIEGEPAPPATDLTDPPATTKRGPGRPKGLTKKAIQKRAPAGLDRVQRVQWQQDAVIQRQRADCKRLATVIKNATPGTEDPKDIASLARSTAILHDMEAKAHNFGNSPGRVQQVIVVPMVADSMEKWNDQAVKALGAITNAADPTPARRVEADIQGQPGEGGGEE